MQSQNDLQGVYESPEDIEPSNVSKIVDQARNGIYDDETNAPEGKKSHKPAVRMERRATADSQLYNIYYDEDGNVVYYAYCDHDGNEVAWTDKDGNEINPPNDYDPFGIFGDDNEDDAPRTTLDDEREPEPQKETPSEEAARAINKETNAPEGDEELDPNDVFYTEVPDEEAEAKEESNKAAQDVGNDKPIESEKPQEKKEEKEKPKNGKRYDDWEVKGVDIPSERDIAVVTQVRRNLNIGWGDAFKKVAQRQGVATRAQRQWNSNG